MILKSKLHLRLVVNTLTIASKNAPFGRSTRNKLLAFVAGVKFSEKSMNKLFGILILLFSSSVNSDELKDIFYGWGLVETPVEAILDLKKRDRESSEDLRIMWDRHVLSDSDGKLVLKIDDDYSRKTHLSFGTITYSSIDQGEFGGELGYTIDGKYTPILKGNVRQLILYGDKIYILEGLDHMMSRGAVYVIPDAGAPTVPHRITLLPESPKAALITKQGQLVIVGSNGIYRVSEDYFDISYWNAFWSGVFLWGPTSIVERDNKFLIGLPKGVAVLELNFFEDPTIKLYMTNEFNKSIQPTANASVD
jgi:hypothetical protein